MIRPMEKSDVKRVYEIANDAFFRPKSMGELIKDIEKNSFLSLLVYEDEGEVLGYYISSMILDIAELFTIAVDKQNREKGIGSKLLEHFIKECELSDISEIWLEVSTKNKRAIALYEKHSFIRDGLRKNYYQSIGEDAYNMKRKLK